MGILQWPQAERPRERLLAQGPEALSPAELLAILLRTGRRGMSAVDLARRELESSGDLQGLYATSPQQLAARLGPAAACTLLAAAELGKRLLQDRLREGPVCARPEQLSEFLRGRLVHETVEVFLGLFLDNRLRLLACEELARGTLAGASVYPREVVKRALAHHAAAVIFAHNHPSGSRQPSTEDRLLTERLGQALRLVEVRLVDHFIIGEGEAVSMAALGMV